MGDWFVSLSSYKPGTKGKARAEWGAGTPGGSCFSFCMRRQPQTEEGRMAFRGAQRPGPKPQKKPARGACAPGSTYFSFCMRRQPQTEEGRMAFRGARRPGPNPQKKTCPEAPAPQAALTFPFVCGASHKPRKAEWPFEVPGDRSQKPQKAKYLHKIPTNRSQKQKIELSHAQTHETVLTLSF